MPQYLFYNGNWLPEEQPLIAAGNRGLRYGDGLFETLCVVNGDIRLGHWHFERLFNGLQLLQFNLPSGLTAAALSAHISTLCEKNAHPAARARLTVFRGNGLLTDTATAPDCIIQSQFLPSHYSLLTTHDSPLTAGIYPLARKSPDAFSHLKSNNYLASSMAARYAREQRWDDALLLNARGNVCESSVANIFILRGRRLYTPPLSEGCIAGVMRRFLLHTLPQVGYGIEEAPLLPTDIYTADEVWLTNALSLRSLARCDSAVYKGQQSRDIFPFLQEKWETMSQLSG
jgi:branched-chain amino acid aminotransferase